MSAPTPQAITTLLQKAQRGSTEAFDALYSLVYDELRRLAHAVRRGRGDATLSTTALVHEAYFRLLPSKEVAWQDRAHFFRVAARAMRQVLVRAAKRRQAQKRGGGQLTIAFDERMHAPVAADQFLALNAALGELESMHPRQAQVVECRFFAGLSVEETATALGVSAPTYRRRVAQLRDATAMAEVG